jgi:hypothetical protein
MSVAKFFHPLARHREACIHQFGSRRHIPHMLVGMKPNMVTGTKESQNGKLLDFAKPFSNPKHVDR